MKPSKKALMTTPPPKKPEGRALVVFAHGEGYVLVWEGDEHIENFISDLCGGESFPMSKGVGHAKVLDGLWIGELALVDDGPGDWGGEHECALDFTHERPATLEEWKHHLDGEWPWEPFLVGGRQ